MHAPSFLAAAFVTLPVAGQSFTVIGIPDTQNYSESYPEIFAAQTQWCADSAAALGIEFISHYGDVVQHGDDLGEWANAEAALDILDASGIPWGVCPGNHDVTPSGSPLESYIPQYFEARYGASHWQGKPWFVGSSPTGMSNAQVFTAGGREWLWLHIECDMAVRELAWAQGVLDQHRDKAAVMTTHRWLQDAEDYQLDGFPIVSSGWYPSIWYVVEGAYADGGIETEEAWNWFVRKNPSIFMINCGHFHEEYRQTHTNVAGLPVREVLADYQDDPNGGNGWLRIMEFDVGANEINFESYSPTLDQYRSADESLFTYPVQFDEYRLAAGNDFRAFQHQVNGYVGTQDTWISEANPNTPYGGDDTRESDDDVSNSLISDSRGQALIKWTGVFSEDGANGTIPSGVDVLEAYITIEIAEDIDSPFYDPDFFVYEVLVPWNESSTWNSLGNGLQVGSDLGLLVGSFTGDNDPDGDGMRRLDVTGLVQSWADGQANHGIAILPEIISGNDDGISIWTSEAGNPMFHPRLEVIYVAPAVPCVADIIADGVVNFSDLLSMLNAWGNCGECPADLDGDGIVDFGDLLQLLSEWGPCA